MPLKVWITEMIQIRFFRGGGTPVTTRLLTQAIECGYILNWIGTNLNYWMLTVSK